MMMDSRNRARNQVRSHQQLSTVQYWALQPQHFTNQQQQTGDTQLCTLSASPHTRASTIRRHQHSNHKHLVRGTAKHTTTTSRTACQLLISRMERGHHPKLEYCGCELENTPEGGRRLHQESYFSKAKPITISKNRNLQEPLNHWPAAQTSPHLQCSTSTLSGQVSKATVNTATERNKLLKFAKEHKDVSLYYNHIGHPSGLQLLCFFDAGFTARADGSSQGGYIQMLVNKQLFTSGED